MPSKVLRVSVDKISAQNDRKKILVLVSCFVVKAAAAVIEPTLGDCRTLSSR